MEHEIDFEFRQDALERGAIEDRSSDLALHFGAQRRLQRRDVERHDGSRAVARELIDETVANLAVGAGNQDDGFSHQGQIGGGTATNSDARMAMIDSARQATPAITWLTRSGFSGS